MEERRARATARRRRQRHARSLRRKAAKLEALKLDTEIVRTEAQAEQAGFQLVSRKRRAEKAKAAAAAAKAKGNPPPKAPGAFRKVRVLVSAVSALSSAIEEDRSTELPDLLDRLNNAATALRPPSSSTQPPNP